MAARIIPAGLYPGEPVPVTSLPGGIVPPKPAINPDRLDLIAPTRFKMTPGMGLRIKPSAPVIVITKPNVDQVNVSNPWMNSGRKLVVANPANIPVRTNFSSVVPNLNIMPAKPSITSRAKDTVTQKVISERNIAAPVPTGGNAVLLAKQKEASVAVAPVITSAAPVQTAPEPVQAGVPMIVWIIAGGLAVSMLFGSGRR